MGTIHREARVIILTALALWGCEVANPAYDPPTALQDDGAGSLVASLDAGFFGDAALATALDAVTSKSDTGADTTAVPTAANDLTAYWPFDEGAGGVAGDRGPLQMQVALQGAQWLRATPAVTFANVSALAFDGTGAAAVASAARLGTLANPFTLSFWFRPDRGGTGSRETLVTLSQPAASRSFHVGRYRDGRIAVWTFGGPELVAGPVPATNMWHHAAYTWDGTTSRLWLNNAQVASSSRGPGVTTPTFIMFGGIPDGEPYAGTLDEVRLYEGALPASDIAFLAKGGY